VYDRAILRAKSLASLPEFTKYTLFNSFLSIEISISISISVSITLGKVDSNLERYLCCTGLRKRELVCILH
jgi:hypothetical protein